ncbi:ribosome hibernation-promoting factor, HPF/YfiA family [Microbacterium amylolyticum]|uniref:Ribosome hibernation promoting factor n=1 Tax=Microbacterium amylolyticum TaxID=936337 RepID=A0ABS4ZJX8_9MICO|nr:ribosome-associated translation inhibitor RaiA [Microbacterium amylolyticum]MBP2437599.1 ribosomal subunit interface protein [Microbacterium amylolyticum]
MDTSIVGVGVSITDRFRTVVEEKVSRVETLAPRAERLDVKVTQAAHRHGRVEEAKVELTVTTKGKVARAEAREEDKFAALETALDKLTTQLRRAKDKRVSDRQRPRSAHLAKDSGSLEGIDITPVDVATLHAVATGAVPIQNTEDEEEYTPVVIRTKTFGPEWMTVEEAVDRMELVGHDFFLFVDVKTDHPSVVYRRRGWDYGVISLETQAPPAKQLAS